MRNSFNNFIVNDSNKEAYEYSVKVAKQETTEANPLFISGPHGCGKSHLLDGIWHYYVSQENGKHPEWIASFGLTDRFKGFTLGKYQFADKFNEIDLILIDDIDQVDDNSNGELLPQVIDELVSRGKQICLASNKSLDELNYKLKVVLLKGKCVTLSMPSKEEQRSFYKQYCKKEGIELYKEEPYDYLCETEKSYRKMKSEIYLIKAGLIADNSETAGIGKEALKKYIR